MMDKTLLFAGWAVTMFFLATTLPVSRLAINPTDVTIEGDKVTVVRTFPGDALGLPRPSISYLEAVRPLTQSHNGGQSCQVTGGPFPYDREDDVGVWNIPWAKDCLDDPVGFRWHAEWKLHIGLLQFGPVDLDTTVLKKEGY